MPAHRAQASFESTTYERMPMALPQIAQSCAADPCGLYSAVENCGAPGAAGRSSTSPVIDLYCSGMVRKILASRCTEFDPPFDTPCGSLSNDQAVDAQKNNVILSEVRVADKSKDLRFVLLKSVWK